MPRDVRTELAVAMEFFVSICLEKRMDYFVKG